MRSRFRNLPTEFYFTAIGALGVSLAGFTGPWMSERRLSESTDSAQAEARDPEATGSCGALAAVHPEWLPT